MKQENRKTESRNPDTRYIDTLSTLEMMKAINREDKKVALAVETQIPQIARSVDAVYERLRAGGRLFYCGAGTSGRMGILDASECQPTYNVPPSMVQALIAGGKDAVFHAVSAVTNNLYGATGGDTALRNAVKNAEDDTRACGEELARRGFGKGDVLVGIAASGTTPFVLGGLAYARNLGALTIGICCNDDMPMAQVADICITPVVGPEVITGSTRMKSDTAQKLVLNMISTGVMIRLGKVYGNLMVDLQVSNAKLADRARRIVAQAASVDDETAEQTLRQCDGEVKTAIVQLCTRTDTGSARRRLAQCGGVVRRALDYVEGNCG